MNKRLKKKKIKSKSKPQSSLSQLRDALRPLVSKANKMVEDLVKNNLLPTSLVEARETKSTRADISHEQLFSVDELHRFRDLRREAARLDNFLSDESSTLEGARLQEQKLAASQWEGAFGNQWRQQYGRAYDPTRVDAETLELAGQTFRRLEEFNSLKIYGESAYGSDTLMTEIYEYIVSNNLLELPENRAVKDLLTEFTSRLNQHDVLRQQEAELSLLSDDQGLLDNVRSARTLEEFLSNI